MNTLVVARCPVCSEPLDAAAATTTCDACATPHHVDCWTYNEGCAVYGCRRALEASARRPLTEVEEAELPGAGRLLAYLAGTVACNAAYTLVGVTVLAWMGIWLGQTGFDPGIRPGWWVFDVLTVVVLAGLALGFAAQAAGVVARAALGRVKDWRPLQAIEESCGLDPASRQYDQRLRRRQELTCGTALLGSLTLPLLFGWVGMSPTVEGALTGLAWLVFLSVAVASTHRYARCTWWSFARLLEWRSIRRSLRLPQGKG